MFNIKSLILSTLVVAMSSSATMAAVNYVQRWTQQRTSHQSIVVSCDNPMPINLVAMDDFVPAEDGVIDAVAFWGEVLVQAQLQQGRGYYVAIYEDNGNCGPGELVYKDCISPRVRFAGFDCNQRRVYLFRSPLSPFAVNGGQRYWLQISEDDSRSAREGGQQDWRWSGRRPIIGCDALQRDAAGNIFSPLLDGCDQMPVDLSFALRIN